MTVNWEVVAHNFYGPIIDRARVTTRSVTGSAASGTLNSADPNAHFSC